MPEFMTYVFAIIISVAISAGFTYLIRNFAVRYKILDYPKGDRKIHKYPKPLLGGLAIYISFCLILLFFALFTDLLLGGYLLFKHIIGMLLGGLILIIGGSLDDKYNLSPKKQFIWPILAVLVVIVAGIGIDYISNPLGEAINLNQYDVLVFEINSIPYYFTVLSDIFTVIWLLGMIYTTKFLDGLDGLVAGLGVIGGVVIFILSLGQEVMQPETALIAAIFGGVVFGFLLFNFYPAKIFLGEGGSTLIGFILGVLAILSGSKIATALLIFGIAIFDIFWAIIRRVLNKKSPFVGDRSHLHHRLLDAGLSQRQAVIFLYFLSAVFGLMGIIFEGVLKIFFLLILFVFVVGLLFLLYLKNKKKSVKIE